jgi:diguanylate cyclase (GGDEF)-like protein
MSIRAKVPLYSRVFIGFVIGIVAVMNGANCGYSATSSNDQITVRVGLYQNAPKIYRDHHGEPAGLFITLIQAIASEEDWQLDFIDCEWQACLTKLARGDIDLMPDVAYSQQRDHLYDFHQIPVAHSWSVVLTADGKPTLSIPALNNKRIALLAGAIQQEPLAAIMAGYGLHYSAVSYPSYAAAFAAVRDGEVDAVVSNSFYADLYARKYGLHETPIVFNPVTLYYAVTKGDPLQLLPRIDAHLKVWRYDEHSVYYAALKAAMVPAQETVVPPNLHTFLISAVALVALFVVMNGVLRWQVRRKTTQLQRVAHRLDHMLHSSPVILYQLVMENGQARTRWVSDNLERLFGFVPEEFVRQDLWFRQIHPQDREAVMANLAQLSKQGQLVQEYRILDSHGNTRYVRDEMRFLHGVPGKPDEIVGSWNDLTESRVQAARLSFLTHYDPLTRLPNRSLLLERLTHAIYRAQREDRSLALLYTDLDRFKHINDSLGPATGDIVLKTVAHRLSKLLHTGDILARIGGNGFVMLLEEQAGQREALDMAKAITQSFIEPITLQGQDVVLTLSVGISLYPTDGIDAVTLLQHAEAAMYEAKNAGRNLHRLYASSAANGMEDRLILESALRGAIARNELLLHFQPQINLQTHALVGVEALVRWQHPKLGLVSPGQFIPIAEEMGIIGEIGAWVLEAACRQMMTWQNTGLYVPRVAVNLSTQQVDDEALVPLIRDILARTGCDPRKLELEVTESLIMREPEKATTALAAFRGMGIQLAIDDFGTGYSSLNYLKHLPLDRLKIDQSFVQDIGKDASSEVISRAIIGLARSLELETVAEGIETEHQLEFLRKEGCTVGQGYLISHPLSAEGLREFPLQVVPNWRNA